VCFVFQGDSQSELSHADVESVHVGVESSVCALLMMTSSPSVPPQVAREEIIEHTIWLLRHTLERLISKNNDIMGISSIID
jgi:hypothetical protein